MQEHRARHAAMYSERIRMEEERAARERERKERDAKAVDEILEAVVACAADTAPAAQKAAHLERVAALVAEQLQGLGADSREMHGPALCEAGFAALQAMNENPIKVDLSTERDAVGQLQKATTRLLQELGCVSCEENDLELDLHMDCSDDYELALRLQQEMYQMPAPVAATPRNRRAGRGRRRGNPRS